MKYKTQFTAQNERKVNFEVTGNESPVVKTVIRGNSEKLAQMTLAGVYAEGSRLGYEFGPEDRLPENIEVRPTRGTDVIDVMVYAEKLSKRIREAIATGGQKKGDETNETEPVRVREENATAREVETEKN